MNRLLEKTTNLHRKCCFLSFACFSPPLVFIFNLRLSLYFVCFACMSLVTATIRTRLCRWLETNIFTSTSMYRNGANERRHETLNDAHTAHSIQQAGQSALFTRTQNGNALRHSNASLSLILLYLSLNSARRLMYEMFRRQTTFLWRCGQNKQIIYTKIMIMTLHLPHCIAYNENPIIGNIFPMPINAFNNYFAAFVHENSMFILYSSKSSF